MSEDKKLKVNVDPARVESDENSFMPLCDIYEQSDGNTVVVAEMPGAKAESVDIRVDKGVLTITADATRKSPGDEYRKTFAGFVGGQFFRAFAISDDVDRDKIEAAYKDGLLTLKLPKATEAKTRKIEITEG